MFHPSVVFEEGNVVGEGLDSQHVAELVVDLDAGWTHVVSQAVPFLTGRKLRAEFTVVTRMEAFAQKHGYVIRFDGVREGADQLLIDRAERFAVGEDEVRGVLGLHDAPMNAALKAGRCWTELSGVSIEQSMQTLDGKSIGQLPGLREVVDLDEGVLDLGSAQK